MKNTKGFTLIELLVAAAVSLILVFAIGMAIESALRSSGGIERKVIAQQDVRGTLEIMAMEIRMASYNPLFGQEPVTGNVDRFWRGAGCGATLCCDQNSCPLPLDTRCQRRGIQEATTTSITVQMDISDRLDGYNLPDGNGQIMGGPAETNEIIRYNYVTAGGDRYITRETNCGGAQPFLGDAVASLHPLTVRVSNEDIPDPDNPGNPLPVFRYFDALGNRVVPGAGGNLTDNQIHDLRMIEITLAVETEEINPDTKQRRRMIYSSRETLKNHIFYKY